MNITAIVVRLIYIIILIKDWIYFLLNHIWSNYFHHPGQLLPYHGNTLIILRLDYAELEELWNDKKLCFLKRSYKDGIVKSLPVLQKIALYKYVIPFFSRSSARRYCWYFCWNPHFHESFWRGIATLNHVNYVMKILFPSVTDHAFVISKKLRLQINHNNYDAVMLQLEQLINLFWLSLRPWKDKSPLTYLRDL